MKTAAKHAASEGDSGINCVTARATSQICGRLSSKNRGAQTLAKPDEQLLSCSLTIQRINNIDNTMESA
ncbi:hypothetical protein IQ266_26110 [filamentous cyanobacterium LEGE 11480]|uniref:Uncharacterized protein n=1 Tax=Romeriopsis navalis LEGE 11480 TaxID=2777977 RepID=A0A928Z5W3_9CYAN|nr:hypothetical protein [Romeriopsis navalis]MBE9033214.1 hypothetical protein [Romeriopsis navalis LEGE 11480]